MENAQLVTLSRQIALQHQMDVVANNMANINTTGFKGEHVEIIGMAAEDDCRHELYVRIRWSGRTLAVPLAQLRLLDAEADAVQAVEDWHYWVAQHYEF